MNRLKLIALTTALMVVGACTTLGLTAATFNQKLAGGYTAVTTIADSATILHHAGKLSDADRDNLAKQDETLKDALDVTRTLHASTPAAGDAKLTATLAALTALQTYLDKVKGAAP